MELVRRMPRKDNTGGALGSSREEIPMDAVTREADRGGKHNLEKWLGRCRAVTLDE
jgi:hypothetical protein